MTVLGKNNDKSDDKVELVGKTDVATIMPNRHRLLKLQKRRSIITVILSIGFLFIFLCGVFLTICFIKRIGPFRRHISEFCTVSRYENQKIMESYEIEDKYSMLKVPKVTVKHKVYEPSTILHIFDKQKSVILHRNVCFVKPMMRYQTLISDWFENSHTVLQQRLRAPSRFTEYSLRIVRPQLSEAALSNEVGEHARSFCESRPVYQLMFSMRFHWPQPCTIACKQCPRGGERFVRRLVGGRLCRVCQCEAEVTTATTAAPEPMKATAPAVLHSSNRVDPNCKAIRCVNKCAHRKLLGCVQCKCADAGEPHVPPPIGAETEADTESKGEADATSTDASESIGLGSMIVKERESPIFGHADSIDGEKRQKRSAPGGGCTVVATVFEGYTPFDREIKAPLNHIYDC